MQIEDFHNENIFIPMLRILKAKMIDPRHESTTRKDKPPQTENVVNVKEIIRTLAPIIAKLTTNYRKLTKFRLWERPSSCYLFRPSNKSESIKIIKFDSFLYTRGIYTETFLQKIRRAVSHQPKVRTSKENQLLLTITRENSKDFRRFSFETQKAIIKKSLFMEYKKGTKISRSGENVNFLSIIVIGEGTKDGDFIQNKAKVERGTMMGFEEIMCGKQRESSLTARADSIILLLYKEDLRGILHIQNMDEMVGDYLPKEEIFEVIISKLRHKYDQEWFILDYRNNEIIAENVHLSDWIYVVLGGDANIVVQIDKSCVFLERDFSRVRGGNHYDFMLDSTFHNFRNRMRSAKPANRPATTGAPSRFRQCPFFVSRKLKPFDVFGVETKDGRLRMHLISKSSRILHIRKEVIEREPDVLFRSFLRSNWVPEPTLNTIIFPAD